jgi:hypothetical protein
MSNVNATNREQQQRPDKKLQAKLRAMVDAQSLYLVSARLDIGREAILRYLASVSMNTATFRGIEATLAALESNGEEA